MIARRTAFLVLTAALAAPACLSDIKWETNVNIEGETSQNGAAGGGASIGGAGAGTSVGGGAGDGGAAGEVGGSDDPDAGGQDGGGTSGGDGGSAGAGGASSNCPGSANGCLVITSTRLPSPCAGIRYSAPLTATGGTPPYHWEVITPLPGFELGSADGDAGALSDTIVSESPSESLAQTEMVLMVSDSAPAELQQTREVRLDLTLRTSCWFAYLSEDGAEAAPNGPARLHFRDVFLTNDIILPAQADAGPVLDFKFSPDGNWLAFRAGLAGNERLFTYPARGPEPREASPVPFVCGDAGSDTPCGVIDYAWSEDSNHVAVVLGTANPLQDYLSGVSGFGVAAGPGDPWAAVGEAAWFFPDVVPEGSVPLDYHEQLTWIGSRGVGFLGQPFVLPGAELPHAVYSADVVTEGFINGAILALLEGDPSYLTESGATLFSTPEGIAIAREAVSDTLIGLFVFAGAHRDFIGLLSPSRRWVAGVNQEQRLEIYDLFADPFDPFPLLPRVAITAGPLCAEVIAWSRPAEGLERIACRSDEGVNFFDYFFGAEPTLEFAGSVPQLPGPGIRRAFSATGQSFVFGAPSGSTTKFSFVDLLVSPPGVADRAVNLLPPGELEFPVGRDVVLLSDQRTVAEYGLGATTSSDGFTPVGAERSPCQESFGLDPKHWCGAPEVADHLSYSPDSKTLLFEERPGALRIGQPQADPDEQPVTDALASCSERCLAKVYSFQPQFAPGR